MNLNDFFKKTGENDISLAKQSGIPQPTIWRVRTGRVVPRYETAVRISNAINNAISPADIQAQAAEMLKARQAEAVA